ncbi:hypothetical protein ACPA9J_11635 [Pseudomonas aeruginosa]
MKFADMELIGIPHRIVISDPRPQRRRPGIQGPPRQRSRRTCRSAN